MQAVKSINKAKAVTEEKIISNEKSISRPSIVSRIISSIKSIIFGDINSINTDSEKIRNYNNYSRVKNTEIASNTQLRTLFR